MRTTKTVILLVIGLFLALPDVRSWACTCSGSAPTRCSHPTKTDVVFVATVIDIENPPTERRDDQQGISRYHFRVDERISGTTKTELQVLSTRGGADCSFHFEQNKQYLVFPTVGDKGELWAYVCSNTRAISQAKALLTQLRAMRDGTKVASLYGYLNQTQQPYPGAEMDDFDRPLSNTRIQLQSDGQLFETTSDSEGVYAFYDLPGGTFRIKADLPANLEIAQTILDSPLPPLKLPSGACYEYDIDALPTGNIRGHVIGPDGKALRFAGVDLFRADKHKDGLPNWYESQDSKGYFEFRHVAPGDYLIVYNNQNRIDPDMPFPRTYYPGVADVSQSVPLHLEGGQQRSDADIHVSGAIPTRDIHVKLIAENGKIPDIAYVVTRGEDGSSPGNEELGPGLFAISIFRNVRYSFHGEGYCSATHKDVKTDSVEVDGSDDSASEITLVFPKPCRK